MSSTKQEPGPMTWQDVLDHPSLQDLPFKIELNAWGQIVMSPPSNTTAEMDEKIVLYLAKGARAVWICDLEERLSFHGNEGTLDQSDLAPDFPSQI